MWAIIEKPLKYMAGLVTEDLRKPFIEMQKQVSELSEKVDKLAEEADKAREFDIALGADRIKFMCRKALDRGYRTEDESTTLPFIYASYRERGGNHGADLLYSDFIKLQTEQAWRTEHAD